MPSENAWLTFSEGCVLENQFQALFPKTPGIFLDVKKVRKMKVKDILNAQDEFSLSLEFVPPQRGSSIDDISKVMDDLMNFSPRFINITNHPPRWRYMEIDGKIKRVPLSKRPGTIGLTAALKYRYPSVEVIPHLVCAGQDKYQLEDTLIDLNYLGIENVFVVRGDIDESNENTFQEEYRYAKDLVKQISNMNKGVYLYPIENAKATNFCVGVAGYPEKHYESLNLYENIRHLKEKVDAGADYVITQMFFDFEVYKKFVELAREMGINVPIIPGIKPVVSARSIRNIPRRFFVDIPQELARSIQEAKTPRQEWNAGIRYMAKLIEKLLNYGVDGIHIFTMGRGKSTKDLLQAVFGKARTNKMVF